MDDYNLVHDTESDRWTGRVTVNLKDTSITFLGWGYSVDEVIRSIDNQILNAGIPVWIGNRNYYFGYVRIS